MPVPCFAHVDLHGPYEQTKHVLRTAELYLKDERSILFFFLILLYNIMVPDVKVSAEVFIQQSLLFMSRVTSYVVGDFTATPFLGHETSIPLKNCSKVSLSRTIS